MLKKNTSIKIAGTEFDRRAKLSKTDKDEIYKMYHKQGYSQTALAAMFKVSRRTISFITDPSQLDLWKKKLKLRGGSKRYYDREQNNKKMRDYRLYKSLVSVSARPTRGWSIQNRPEFEKIIKKYRGHLYEAD